jgi:hypothetical protein
MKRIFMKKYQQDLPNILMKIYPPKHLSQLTLNITI